MLSSRAWILAALTVALSLGAKPWAPGCDQRIQPAQPADTAGLTLPDTLPPYRDVRGISRDRSAVIAAAVDALHGETRWPPPLVLKSFHRDGKAVVVDMVADSLPRIRYRNGGGTVRVLADGRRVILGRHN